MGERKVQWILKRVYQNGAAKAGNSGSIRSAIARLCDSIVYHV